VRLVLNSDARYAAYLIRLAEVMSDECNGRDEVLSNELETDSAAVVFDYAKVSREIVGTKTRT
jgi:hypothetical protein